MKKVEILEDGLYHVTQEDGRVNQEKREKGETLLVGEGLYKYLLDEKKAKAFVEPKEEKSDKKESKKGKK